CPSIAAPISSPTCYHNGALWHYKPKANSNAIGYVKLNSRSHDAVIRVYDETGNVIETHEHAAISKIDGRLNLLLRRIDRDFRRASGRSLTLCVGLITSAAHRREH